MTFLFPPALLSLLLIPLLAAAYIAMQRRRQKYALRYASVSLVRQAVGSGPGIRRHIPPVLFLLALLAMGLSFARPEITMANSDQQGTVILSVDVSGSMQATDVEPDRMEATKEALRSFVNAQPGGVEVGLVAFSDSAVVLQPATKDKGDVLRAINRLQPVRGTNIGAGLEVALQAATEALDTANETDTPAASTPTAQPDASATATPPPSASIVLVSDGESNTGPDPMEVAQGAVDAGIRVYTVGIGTPEGVTLHVQGQSVFTRLDEATLQGVADMTGGRYLSAQDEGELKQVYDDLAREEQVEPDKIEVTYLGAAGAMALSILGAGLSLLWFNRLP